MKMIKKGKKLRIESLLFHKYTHINNFNYHILSYLFLKL